MQIPIGAEDKFAGMVDLVTMKAYYYDGHTGENVREEEIPAELLEEAEAEARSSWSPPPPTSMTR